MGQHQSLNHPLVRALAWTLTSPPLINSTTTDAPALLAQLNLLDLKRPHNRDLNPWLTQLDQQPHSLEQWVSERPTHRVGHLFEHLVHYWLVHQTDAQILTHHQQIRDKNKTLGELDFLFRLEGRIIHLETAVKFYLKANNQQSLKSFVGPNSRETLFQKTQQIVQE